MATAGSQTNNRNQRHHRALQLQVRSVRVLLRPGKYVMKQAIQIQAAPNVVVSLETIELPKNLYRSNNNVSNSSSRDALARNHSPIIMEQPLPRELPPRPSSSSKPSFRNLFCCQRPQNNEPESVTDDITEWDNDWLLHNTTGDAESNSHATLILRSRRHNEPAFRVQQGLLRLQNIEIQHNLHGLDIWNGNAAVQIQPPTPPVDNNNGNVPQPPSMARPTAILEQCLVTSQSGRGIVNIDGGKVILRKCAFADCATTGVYIGGPGLSAVMEESDVICNGVGNHHHHRRGTSSTATRGHGIARGHSGIYLERDWPAFATAMCPTTRCRAFRSSRPTMTSCIWRNRAWSATGCTSWNCRNRDRRRGSAARRWPATIPWTWWETLRCSRGQHRAGASEVQENHGPLPF